MPPPGMLCMIRDDVTLTTWLLIGACLQSVLTLLLPPRVAFLPAGLLLISRLGKALLQAGGVIHDTNRDKVVEGRLTTQFPKDVQDDELVVFVLGARFNHPFSRLAPGVMNGAAKHFAALWVEAEAKRKEWGYLGRTSDMLATDDEANNAIITISYWNSRKLLGEFAQSPVHVAAWNWFEETSKRHKHLSFMHEVYTVPKGHWEHIHRNAVPFGLAQTQIPNLGKDGSMTLDSGLVPAIGSRWKKVGLRMELDN